MKTLVNKRNPAIRIIAPEIVLSANKEQYWIAGIPQTARTYLAKEWTLVEEEETIVKTIRNLSKKAKRCEQQAVEDQDYENYVFWQGFHNCAENILREVEEPTEDWKEKRKKECPFRIADGCKQYAGVISECTGACSWVVDYPKLKEIQDKKKQEQPDIDIKRELHSYICSDEYMNTREDGSVLIARHFYELGLNAKVE